MLRILLSALFLSGAITTMAWEINTGALALTFSEPAEGMTLQEISVPATGSVLYQNADPSGAWWAVELTTPGNHEVALVLNNLSPGEKTLLMPAPGCWEQHYLFTLPEADNSLKVTIQIQAAENGNLTLQLQGELSGSAYTFRGSSFPQLAHPLAATKGKLLFPRGNLGSRLVDYPIRGIYPSCESQVQFLGIFAPGNQNGLYLGIHDSGAARKTFLYQNDILTVYTDAENISLPGKSHLVDFPLVLSPAADPWAACRIYRGWALQQSWTARGPLAQRKDIPENLDEIDLWLNLDGPPAMILQQTTAELEKNQLNLGLHWYNWNIYHFDRHYPDFFPAQEGFTDTVQNLKSKNVQVMPYINGRLWDMTMENFEIEAKNEATWYLSGEPVAEDYGSGVKLAAMCPSSKAHFQKLETALSTLVQEYGVNAIYVDQVAAASPVLCYDPNHGHPLGGGSWWTELQRQRWDALTKPYSNKILFSSENGSEPYIGAFTHFLLWMAVYADDFPSLMAVYNDHARYFCSPSEPADDFVSFVGLQSRCAVWGIEPGWLRWLHHGQESSDPELEKRQDYIRKVASIRRAAREFQRHGQLFCGMDLTGQTHKVPVIYTRNGDYARTPTPGETDSIYGAFWQGPQTGLSGAIIANLLEESTSITFQWPEELCSDLALSTFEHYQSDGSWKVIQPASDGSFTISLAPFDLTMVRCKKSPAMETQKSIASTR